MQIKTTLLTNQTTVDVSVYVGKRKGLSNTCGRANQYNHYGNLQEAETWSTTRENYTIIGHISKNVHLTTEILAHPRCPSTNEQIKYTIKFYSAIIQGELNKKKAPKRSGTTIRHGLVGASISLWGWALRSPYLKHLSV